MKRLILVDGNALLHRAYHATPPLSTSKGELVNAVYGFSLMLLKALADLKPDFIAIAWDEKGPTFRHQAYTQYKATRGPADNGLSMQYGRVFEVTKALNIPEFRLGGFEADDLIGTLAKQAVEKEKSLEVIILTGDRDIMQIISPRVKVMMPKKTLQDVGLYGVAEFMERFGFTPEQMIDYKALAGDQSDNIPGVPGIGEVSATKLIKEFGSVEKIYQPKNLKTLPDRMQKLLAEGAESAVMSKSLATLDLNAPISLELKKCLVHDFNRDEAVRLFKELEFTSLIARLPGDGSGDKKEADSAVEQVGFETSQSKETTELDLAVSPILERMSKKGVLIDTDCLSKLGEQLKERLVKLESGIYDHVGHQFNLNSPKQLSEVLFDELNLPVIRKTKTGRSTDEETLRQLQDAHPMIPLFLEYRQLFKLVSTYVDALPKYIAEDARVHSTFNVEGAATGRLSSQNPNLQNIPIKGELGSELRKAFVAPKKKVLLGADYSQIELRIMAYLANDSGLKKAFREGLDIHAATAAKIFKIPVEAVSKAQRTVGKTMNFATLYGQGPRALAKQLGVSTEIAKAYIDDYYLQFPKVLEWKQKTLDQGYKMGYVETLIGRRRYIPELQASNKALQAFGERAAINHPVQGTSADMIKKAMLQINQVLGQGCDLILQIHDELLFECEPENLQKTAKMIKERMEQALTLGDVPVVVDLKSGQNWGEMTKLSFS